MKQKFFKTRSLLVTSKNLGRTSRACLSLSLASPIGHPMKKNKTSPTVILSSHASPIGNLRNKTKSDCKSLHALFLLQQENWSYADAAVFISVQTGQNLHESISTFYKSYRHLPECFLTSQAKHILPRIGFRGKSFFSLHCTFIFTFFQEKFLAVFFCPQLNWYQVFLFNTNNLPTDVWFQVFLSNTNIYLVSRK